MQWIDSTQQLPDDEECVLIAAAGVVIALCRLAKAAREVANDHQLSGTQSKSILAPALRGLDVALKEEA